MMGSRERTHSVSRAVFLWRGTRLSALYDDSVFHRLLTGRKIGTEKDALEVNISFSQFVTFGPRYIILQFYVPTRNPIMTLSHSNVI